MKRMMSLPSGAHEDPDSVEHMSHLWRVWSVPLGQPCAVWVESRSDVYSFAPSYVSCVWVGGCGGLWGRWGG